MDAEKPKKDIECLYYKKFRNYKHVKVDGKKRLSFVPRKKNEGK